MLGSLGYQWGRSQTHGAAQMLAPPLPAHVTLVAIAHMRSRDQLLAPSALPQVLSLFSFHYTFHILSSQGHAHTELLLRETDEAQENTDISETPARLGTCLLSSRGKTMEKETRL